MMATKKKAANETPDNGKTMEVRPDGMLQVGTMSPPAMAALTGQQNQMAQILNQLGVLSMQADDLRVEHRRLMAAFKQGMSSISREHGIAPGTPWRVDQDGAIVVGTPG